MAVAAPGRAVTVAPAGELSNLLTRLWAQSDGAVLLGVDAPIGVPIAYAERHARAADFPAFLDALAPDDPFWRVCDRLDEVCGERPFFPRAEAAGSTRAAFAARLGLAPPALLRRCDRAGGRIGCSLFWTLGANQVGKAALSFWREVVLPARRDGAMPVRLWPFETSSLRPEAGVTVAETYSADALREVAGGFRGSKRRQADRRDASGAILAALDAVGVAADRALLAAIADGFGAGADGEDRFDSLLGLVALLRAAGEAPDLPDVRRWEGWIVGRQAAAEPG